MLKRILLVLLFMVFMGLPVSAEPMSLQVSHGTVSPGDVIEISVNMTGNPGMIAYQMDIAYDGTMLVPLEVTKVYGTQPLVSNTILTDGGGHCIRLAYADTVSSTDNGILFVIRFQANAKLIPRQQTDIRIKNCQFFDSQGGLIPAETRNGYVKVEAGQSSGSSAMSEDPASEGSGVSLFNGGSADPISSPSRSVIETNSSRSNYSVLSESDGKSNDTSRNRWILSAIVLVVLSVILTMLIRKKNRSTGSHP